MYEQMLQDVAQRDDVSILTDTSAGSKCKDLLLKSKVQALTGGHLDCLGYEEGALYARLQDVCPENDHVFVIFFNSALWYHPYLAGTLSQYQKKWHNIRYVLFYLDVVGAGVSRTADYLQKRNIFDLVYSYDEEDARRYGFIHWNTLYSADVQNREIQPDTQLYFCCGVTKARIPVLEKFLTDCRDNGVACHMDLVCNEPADRLKEFEPMVNLLDAGNVLPYPQVLQRQLQARCMLEIVQPGRTNLTLRPYEAVAYNRKLLTNSKSILSFAYYNPAYMQYFEKIEDIDWQWVKDDAPVNYGYRGDFSPTLLLADIVYRSGASEHKE